MNNHPPKLVSLVGRSNSGKTTLLTKLIPAFRKLGLRIGTIKNTHHVLDFDKPGKDSWKHAESGSMRVLVASGENLAVFEKTETRPTAVSLSEEWFQGFDLVISEGFKNDKCFKIEVVRAANKKSPLYTDSTYGINAIVSDLQPLVDIPCFQFHEIDQIVSHVCQQLKLKPNK